MTVKAEFEPTELQEPQSGTQENYETQRERWELTSEIPSDEHKCKPDLMNQSTELKISRRNPPKPSEDVKGSV